MCDLEWFSKIRLLCTLVWTIWTNEGICQQQAVHAGLSTGQYEFPFNIQILAGLALLTSLEVFHGGCSVQNQ